MANMQAVTDADFDVERVALARAQALEQALSAPVAIPVPRQPAAARPGPSPRART